MPLDLLISMALRCHEFCMVLWIFNYVLFFLSPQGISLYLGPGLDLVYHYTYHLLGYLFNLFSLRSVLRSKWVVLG